jgi:hypothetical protein
MPRPGTPRRRLEAPSAPTTLTEITRRYYVCAVALSKVMGLPLTDTFMREHRESISRCFIEAGRAGVRLPPAVQLPPLAQANGHSDASIIGTDITFAGDPEAGEIMCSGLPPAPEAPTTNGDTPPVAIPKDAGVPCGGVLIGDLKPAQLAMLVSKTARLVHDEGEAWMPLLGALQSERSQRLERGRQPSRPGSAEKG